ncbi:hypothetical protein MACJ_002259 [Theileria orientalis]|uniref:Uncharacterized protein n=1 Tax=Theileria orientalis TaxID=68886 RepID=A0A976M5U1_THEOR|nr:hypothetical protein MACJ_002259 [Theileria orientalis]
MESRWDSHYELLIFFPNQNYQIANIIDSDIDVWKKRGEAILESVDVYYKKHVPQIVKLNFLISGDRYSEYYGRDTGTYGRVEKPIFDILVFMNNFMDFTLYLDVEKGFSYSCFNWKETEIKGKQFIEFHPKKNVELAKFTCGKDSFEKGPSGQSLKKILRRQVSKSEELIQLVIRDPVKGKSTRCYHMKDNVIQPVSLSTFKKLCAPLPKSIDKNIPTLSYLPDIHEKLPDDYRSEDETQTPDAQINSEDSSRKVSLSSEPPTMSEAISPEIQKRYNSDGTRRLSSSKSPKKSFVNVIRNQIELIKQYSKEKERERVARRGLKQSSRPSFLSRIAEMSDKFQSPKDPDRSERSKSFVRSRVLDFERSKSFFIPLEFEESDQPPKENKSLVLEATEEHISTPTLHEFMEEQEKSEERFGDPFYEIIAERTSEPTEIKPLHEPVVAKETLEDIPLDQSEDIASERLEDPLVQTKCPTSKKSPKKRSGKSSKQSKSVFLQEIPKVPIYSESVIEKYFERTNKHEPEELPPSEPSKEILDGESPEEELKDEEGHYESSKDDVAKKPPDSEETETVAETDFEIIDLGTVEDEISSEPRDFECGAKKAMDVYPHVLETIESQAEPSYEEKTEEIDQKQTQESQSEEPMMIALYLDADDDLESFKVFTQERKNGFCVKLYKPKYKLMAVKYTTPLWVADMEQVECIDVKVHKYFEDLWAIKLNIKTAEGLKISRFFNPTIYFEITEEEYSKLVYELSRKTEKSENKALSLNLAYPDQPHVHATLINTEFSTTYMIYSVFTGYSFTSVYLNQTLVWKASEREPFADTVIYYTHLGRSAYAVLNIPASSLFIKEITFDLVTMKKITNLSQTQVNYLLEFDHPERRLDFNLADPIDNEKFKVSKAHHEGFIIRSFTADTGRVTMIYDGESGVTPTNIVPFRDFKVYYFMNLPVLVLTDPHLGPVYFKRTSSGWTTTKNSEVISDLEALRLDLEDTSAHPRTFISLDYDAARDKNFLVEMGRRRHFRYKSFVPVMGNIISRIFSSSGFVLRDRDRKSSSGATFLLKDNKPYKVELLINARAGLKKMVFKVFEHESSHWTEVDESLFLKY